MILILTLQLKVFAAVEILGFAFLAIKYKLKSSKTVVMKVEHNNNIGAGVSAGPVWYLCGHSYSPPGDAGAVDLAAGQ